jgi:hypothetical protein
VLHMLFYAAVEKAHKYPTMVSFLWT